MHTKHVAKIHYFNTVDVANNTTGATPVNSWTTDNTSAQHLAERGVNAVEPQTTSDSNSNHAYQ